MEMDNIYIICFDNPDEIINRWDKIYKINYSFLYKIFISSSLLLYFIIGCPSFEFTSEIPNSSYAFDVVSYYPIVIIW